jgi:AraC-like DNA-binding protein
VVVSVTAVGASASVEGVRAFAERIRPARFGAKADCLVFPASLLALRFPRSPKASRPAPPSLPDSGFVDSVRRANRYLLTAGDLHLDTVAEVAGQSVRSIQRRLAASGLSFARLVDEGRFERAARLLRDPGIRIIDVSVALGYTDAANFTRTLRRCSGVSPVEFRRSVLRHQEAGG